MRNTLLLLILMTIGFCGFAQENSELEKRNGFKDIKLGMAADSVKGARFKKDIKVEDEFDAKVYTVEHELYKSIGEVGVGQVEVKAYRGLVYEISVIAEKDPRLMKALESIYGRADYDMKTETYFWKSNSLIMTFKAHSKHQLEMVYHSFVVKKMMKEDKAKKVQAIADDF